MIQIRNEQKSDYQIVEDITREAFYNMYVPGCMEHYLVHIMRGHEDFIPELDFVLELDGKVIGNIMYTKAKLTDENGEEKEIITFGPVSILPKYQQMGYGKLLMEHSFKLAVELGYDTIVIFGSPAKEFKEVAFDGRKWTYSGSPVMVGDGQEAARFDDALPPMAKEYRPSQDEFYIISQAFLG